MAAVIGWAMMASLAANVSAQPVTVTEITDWSTTPNELVTINDPYLGYYGGVYAGINTLQINNDGNITINNGFCIDPFHWNVPGTLDYDMVSLINAPKSPAPLNAFTATEIEDLWAEYYPSALSSSTAAAGLQIAIWELVSSNAVVNDGLPANMGFSTNSIDYGASADLASLATYDGPAANLIAVTGPGQDFVIAAPDGGETFIMLALTLSALILARPVIIKSATPQLRKAKAIPVNRCSSVQGQAN